MFVGFYQMVNLVLKIMRIDIFSCPFNFFSLQVNDSSKNLIVGHVKIYYYLPHVSHVVSFYHISIIQKIEKQIKKKERNLNEGRLWVQPTTHWREIFQGGEKAEPTPKVGGGMMEFHPATHWWGRSPPPRMGSTIFSRRNLTYSGDSLLVGGGLPPIHIYIYFFIK